jgi:hypothetical protein
VEVKVKVEVEVGSGEWGVGNVEWGLRLRLVRLERLRGIVEWSKKTRHP